MPVIIDVADYDRRLSSEALPIHLLQPYPAETISAHEIGQQINRRGYDAPDVIDPAPPVTPPLKPRLNDLFG